MEKEVIDQLAKILGDSGHYAIAEYSHWFFVSSICWSLVGLISIYAGTRFKDKESYGEFEPPAMVFRCIFYVVGILYLGCNLPDIFASEGIALHQLITDIKR